MNAAIARLQNEVPGAKARPAIADLSDADGAAQLLRAVTGVDILVNNAGIYGPQDFYATDDATGTTTGRPTSCPAYACRGAAPGDGQ